jgi:hypothetical protein
LINLTFQLPDFYRAASTDLSAKVVLNTKADFSKEDSSIESISTTGKYIHLLTIKIIVSSLKT